LVLPTEPIIQIRDYFPNRSMGVYDPNLRMALRPDFLSPIELLNAIVKLNGFSECHTAGYARDNYLSLFSKKKFHSKHNEDSKEQEQKMYEDNF
jgi:hypothetical protein